MWINNCNTKAFSEYVAKVLSKFLFCPKHTQRYIYATMKLTLRSFKLQQLLCTLCTFPSNLTAALLGVFGVNNHTFIIGIIVSIVALSICEINIFSVFLCTPNHKKILKLELRRDMSVDTKFT